MKNAFGKTVPLEHYEKIIQARMTQEDYAKYTEWYREVQKNFFESKEKLCDFKNMNLPKVTQEKILSASGEFSNVQYGTTILQNGGCCLFCIEHAARSKGVQINIKTMARIFSEKGYYEPGKGTWHHLLDRLGAQRMSAASDIFKSIAKGSLVTVLIPGHFCNLIGINNGKFIIHDSARENQEIEEKIQDFLPQIRIAWYW